MAVSGEDSRQVSSRPMSKPASSDSNASRTSLDRDRGGLDLAARSGPRRTGRRLGRVSGTVMASSLGSGRPAGMQATSGRLALLSQGHAAGVSWQRPDRISPTWRPELPCAAGVFWSRRSHSLGPGRVSRWPGLFGRPQCVAANDPSVTSGLWAAKAARTSPFSFGGTPKWSSEFASSRCDGIELVGRDPEPAMRLFQAQLLVPWLRARILERPARDVAHPERPHELETGQSRQLGGVPLPKGRVGGSLAGDRVLDDGVAEVVDDRGDGEDTSQPLVQTPVAHGPSSWPVPSLDRDLCGVREAAAPYHRIRLSGVDADR